MATSDKGYIKNCVIISDRTINKEMFEILNDGTIIPHLDGYAIIPIDIYNNLKKEKV